MAVLLLPPMSAHSSAHFQTYSYFYSTTIFDYYEQLVGGLWPAWLALPRPVALRLAPWLLGLLGLWWSVLTVVRHYRDRERRHMEAAAAASANGLIRPLHVARSTLASSYVARILETTPLLLVISSYSSLLALDASFTLSCPLTGSILTMCTKHFSPGFRVPSTPVHLTVSPMPSSTTSFSLPVLRALTTCFFPLPFVPIRVR